MTTLPDDTRVLIKYRCPDCYKGKIPKEESDRTLYDYSYCSTCEGTGWIQHWASTIELARAVNKVNSLLALSK